MGIGDEIMCAGEARRRQEADPRPVAFRGKDGRARWHSIWDNNPRISRNGVDAQWSDNRSGNRPYILEVRADRFIWRERYDCPRGEIYLSPQEQAFGARHAGFLVIEPNIKQRDGNNKDWGFARWQAVVDATPELPWAQVGAAATRRLRRTRFIETADFRLAAAVMAAGRGYVGPEGGLHHAAAALDKPAVVIFGGFISPRQTGYSGHVNLFTGGQACGWRRPCAHCRAALAQITPAMVVHEVHRMVSQETEKAA